MAYALLQILARDGSRLFTSGRARELAALTQLEPTYVPQALHHLTREGWLVRIKPGLYALAPEVFGSSPLHEYELAMALAQPAAISHWSAMHHHDLTDQISHTLYVSVPHTINPPRLKKEHRSVELSLHFVRVQSPRFFGFEQAWVGEARVDFTDLERTLLDGLHQPRYCGGLLEVLEAFEQALPRLNLERLIAYALRLEKAMSKRLGWVLEHLGVARERLTPLAQVPLRGYPPLDPSAPRLGPCHSTWKVQENLPGRLAP